MIYASINRKPNRTNITSRIRRICEVRQTWNVYKLQRKWHIRNTFTLFLFSHNPRSKYEYSLDVHIHSLQSLVVVEICYCCCTILMLRSAAQFVDTIFKKIYICISMFVVVGAFRAAQSHGRREGIGKRLAAFALIIC